jgi:hypothetical protein
MKIEITEDFLIIRVPKAQAEKINLFELRAFIEQGKPIKTEERKENSFIDFSYYEKIINENFEVNKDSFLSTTAIFEILLEKEGGMLSLKKIGGALQKMGRVRTSKRVGDIVLKGYNLKEKN